jgi:hypothetical protein
MGKQKRISVAGTVVTDIRLDRGRLIAHAVDQSATGVTLASHDLNVALEDLPTAIADAAAAVVEYVDAWASDA